VAITLKNFLEKQMDKKLAIVISPNFKDYAKKYLKECIDSIRNQDYDGDLQIFITDNSSTPESFRLLKEIAPEAALVANKNNDGFAKGCNDSIKLALGGDFEYIFLVNMDTVFERSCISKLLVSGQENPKASFIQPRIMLYDKKDTINSLGNDTHFLGFGYCRGYNEEWVEDKPVTKKIMYPSGAGILMRTDILKKIGLFDEALWMYNEDQDLGWRAWLAGFASIVETKAVLYHKYEFAKSIKQFYYMDRNRIIEILKNYKLPTILLILPAFIIMEFGLIAFSIKNNWFKEKIKVWLFFIRPSTWKYLFSERKKIKALRTRKDSEILPLISGKIWYQEIDDWKLKFINPIFNFYFWVVKKIVFW
jgi:GT2 family glycosyltransferase